MRNICILLLLAIAFILVASSCTKDEKPPVPYVQVELGLQKTNTTFKIENVKSITFATPDGLESQTINSYGGAAVMQGDVSVYGRNVAIFEPETDWKYVEFRSETCEKVDIREILYTE